MYTRGYVSSTCINHSLIVNNQENDYLWFSEQGPASDAVSGSVF